MERATIELKVLEILEKLMGPFAPGYPNPEQDWQALGMDSLDQVQFLMEIEDSFEIDIEDADAEKLKTPKEAIEYLASVIA